jgi:hypothetical protein
MSEMQTCYSLRCGYVTETEGTVCPKCGGRLRTARSVRLLGWIQLLIGLFLVGLMGTITFNLAPAMLRPGEIDHGSKFTGSPEQAQLILGVFGLVIIFGLGAMVSGFWQIWTGRRNKWIAIAMLGLIVLFVIAGGAISKSLGN